ncbi:unnamed protein product [Fraxinus pennsylvanica]|uniref:Uncharacterized protein n=1 Tax=Fraxinus pennsylvanica TaxID=56036 RepID=A0AAD1ZP93_9LAMI|nr:unnamed protein product [Fraxinus pennsylvanica]
MLCFKSLLFCLVTAFLFFSCISFSISLGDGEQAFLPTTSGKYGERNSGMVFSWGRTERFLAESDEPPVNSTLVLAAKRTYRKDPLNNFDKYRGGWNISERHYWASVAFTAAPFFVIAAAWFLLFALCLLIICLRHCCCQKEPYGYSRIAYALSLILLILFTIAAIIGCVVLYTGQGKYHSSTENTLEYVVHQANTTSEKLKNVSEYLSAAKKVGVDQMFLPPNVQSDIDRIQTKINSSASTLATKTEDNSKDIKNIIDSVRLALIILSAIMLILTFLGFVFSIFGMQFLVYVLVILGWILVTGTFILCCIFLLLHNVTADTCVAMDQWVQNPTAHTALDDILPCVDNATAQETLTKSKEVTSQLANIMNFVVNNVSNINFPPNVPTLYFNQSGPLLPSLCNPFNPDLTGRACNPGEVDLENATQVWKNYVCDVSPNGICVTTGRLTPTFYSQMAAGVNVSYGLYRYGPFLVDLQDCTFVRQTFTDIHGTYCPGLRRYSSWIYIGLVMVATAVMLSLLFWVIYGRERKHRVYTKEHTPRFSEGDKP